MAIRAWLEGEVFDLRDLADLFDSGDTKIIREGDDYYLSSPEIDGESEATSIHAAATRVLAQLNGIGRVSDPAFRPVTLVGRYSDDSGATHVVVALETAQARARAWAVAVVTDATGLEVERADVPRRSTQYVPFAVPGSAVEEALTLMGQSQPLDWVDLYKVYEIINHDVSGVIWEQGWGVSKTRLEAFTASANHPSISGPTGRHARARGGGGTPKKSMSKPEARQFISALVASWLDAKVGGP